MILESWPLTIEGTDTAGGRVEIAWTVCIRWRTLDDPLFRVLILRGIAWTAGEAVDRFNDLILFGAGVGE